MKKIYLNKIHLTFVLLLMCVIIIILSLFYDKDDGSIKKISLYAGNNSSKVNHIKLPYGYNRIYYQKGSYGHYIRNLQLKPSGSPVLLYNGAYKNRQDVHHRVLKIDVGTYNLQQCADAVMRIRAEYFYNYKRFKKIRFNFTSGHTIYFYKWALGYRPRVAGRRVFFVKSGKRDFSYKNFRKYLIRIYQYAGSMSLSRELKRVNNINNIMIGDVFIKGGFPGHAVFVVDVAKHIKTGKKIFLLAQSYMPAQEIHILKNFTNDSLSPWYSVDFGIELKTPEWTFNKKHLKRFK